jgi:hypothetical protein
MAEEAWIPLESDGRKVGGFCHLLRECLEAAGVATDRVSYKGRTVGHMEQSATFLTVTVPADPLVPEFKEVKVHCFESSTMGLLTDKRRIPLRPASVQTPHLFHHGIPKVLVNPRSKGITSVQSTFMH